MRTSATESKYSLAVVKSGKLYMVKCHVYQVLKVARLNLRGRQIEVSSNVYPR